MSDFFYFYYQPVFSCSFPPLAAICFLICILISVLCNLCQLPTTNSFDNPVISRHLSSVLCHPPLPTTNYQLLIPHRVSPSREHIPLDIHPEYYKKVEDHRRSHGKKAEINKVQPDLRGSDIKFIAEVFANAKCVVFNKTSEPVHMCERLIANYIN